MKLSSFRRPGAAACLIAGLILLGAASSALADTVNLEPSKDNTLYSNNTSFSNGAGIYFFSGKTASFGVRRAVLAFDLTSVPLGSTVSSATLTLHASLTISAPKSFELHRAQADWGEGASDAGSPGGNGTSAEPGDATWVNRFHPGSPWSAAGGDFAAAASGSQTFGDDNTFGTIGPSAGMTADVQAWVNTPASNFGWFLIGQEGTLSAYRFDSRQSPTTAFRPVLTVVFIPPAPVPAASTRTLGLAAGAMIVIALSAWLLAQRKGLIGV